MDLGPKIGGILPTKWMVYFMENPIKMDDLGVPLFLEHPSGFSYKSSHKPDLQEIKRLATLHRFPLEESSAAGLQQKFTLGQTARTEVASL